MMGARERKHAAIWQKIKCSLIKTMQRIEVLIGAAPNVFTGFSPQWLFPVSECEKMACQKEIWIKRRRHYRNRGLFWRTSKISFFRWLGKIRKSLGELNRATRWLCWRKKVSQSIIMWFLWFFKNLLTCPRKLEYWEIYVFIEV